MSSAFVSAPRIAGVLIVSPNRELALFSAPLVSHTLGEGCSRGNCRVGFVICYCLPIWRRLLPAGATDALSAQLARANMAHPSFMPIWRRLSTLRHVFPRGSSCPKVFSQLTAREWCANPIAAPTTAKRFAPFSTKVSSATSDSPSKGRRMLFQRCARIEDAVYFHGSAASRMLRNLGAGIPVCLTVTLTDGLVLARSVFNHSMHYRSVVALGKVVLVEDAGEKLAALRAFTEKILPGRWNEARQPSEKELKATSILRLPLTEASAKLRVGPPEDDAEDYALRVGAGVIPLQLTPGAPIRDARCDASIPTPAYAENYRR